MRQAPRPSLIFSKRNTSMNNANSIFSGNSPELLSRGERWRRWQHKNRQSLLAWTILTPVLIYFLIFAFMPVIINTGLSFTKWNGIVGSPEWVGLDNYARYLKKPYPGIIGNTVLFSVSILALQTSISFFVAILLNQRVRGLGIYRTLWYIPTLTASAIMAQIAIVFISPYGGVINNILESLGQQPVIWTIESFWMRTMIIIYAVWRGLGGPVVLFLAALQGIPRQLYEAAEVDGANRRQTLRYITLPSMKPMIVFVLVTGFIGNFQIFEAILLISKGGPSNSTTTLTLKIYNDAFVNLKLGLASSGAVFMLIILAVFSFTAIRLMNQSTERIDNE